MAIHIRASIVINQPIQEVWSYLDDERKNQAWRGQYVSQVTRLTPGPTAVGTRFQGTMRGGPYVTEITRYEPPEHYAWKYITYPPGQLRGRDGSYHLTLLGQRTRFELKETFDTVGLLGKVLARPLSLLAGLFVGQPLLRRLKSVAERPSNS
jgi:uncharacterized protein YndB with AHSA1/START domain